MHGNREHYLSTLAKLPVDSIEVSRDFSPLLFLLVDIPYSQKAIKRTKVTTIQWSLQVEVKDTLKKIRETGGFSDDWHAWWINLWKKIRWLHPWPLFCSFFFKFKRNVWCTKMETSLFQSWNLSLICINLLPPFSLIPCSSFCVFSFNYFSSSSSLFSKVSSVCSKYLFFSACGNTWRASPTIFSVITGRNDSSCIYLNKLVRITTHKATLEIKSLLSQDRLTGSRVHKDRRGIK